MKRRMGLILIAALVLGLLGGCSLFIGEDGNAYMAFSWTTVPQFFYDENPSTPYTVYNNEYFPSDVGWFYMEYSLVSTTAADFWALYNISKEDGELFKDGDNAWHSLFLSSSGAVWNRQTTSNSVAGDPPPVEKMITLSPEPSGKTRGPVLGTDEIHQGGYVYYVQYGKFE